jgi:hypothetical protein
MYLWRQEVSVNIGGSVTLSMLANMINNDSSNPGVRASIINDGQGLPTSYRLVLHRGRHRGQEPDHFGEPRFTGQP